MTAISERELAEILTNQDISLDESGFSAGTGFPGRGGSPGTRKCRQNRATGGITGLTSPQLPPANQEGSCGLKIGGKRRGEAKCLVITIDRLPDRHLSPNARQHHLAKAGYVKTARTEAYLLARAVMGDWVAPERAVISYLFTLRSRRRRDIDNLISACKPWLDGLVDAGVLVDDDCWHLEISARVAPGERDSTTLTISEVC